MARTEAVFDLVVVARTLVGVLHQQADGSAGGAAFKDARKNAHLIRFLALAGEMRSARAAPLDVRHEVCCRKLQPRRATIDDGAERRAVALTESGDRKQSAKRIAAHGAFRA